MIDNVVDMLHVFSSENQSEKAVSASLLVYLTTAEAAICAPWYGSYTQTNPDGTMTTSFMESIQQLLELYVLYWRAAFYIVRT